MPFNNDLTPALSENTAVTFGENCATVTPGAVDQLDSAGNYYKYFTLAASGDVTFTPYRAADGTTFTMSLQAGQVLPGRVRRITAATATVLGWFD